MHATVLVSLLTLLYVLTVTPAAAECAGKENSTDLPAGYVLLGAWGVGAEHGVSLACERNDSRWTFFLQRNVGGATHLKWLTRVTLVIPKPPKGFTLASNCFLAGQKDPEVIAIVRETRRPRFVSIQRAWRVDTEKELFVEIPMKGIVCVNPASDQ